MEFSASHILQFIDTHNLPDENRYPPAGRYLLCMLDESYLCALDLQ